MAGMISKVQKYKKMPYNFIFIENIVIALKNRYIFTAAKTAGKRMASGVKGYRAYTKANGPRQNNTL